MSKYVVIIVTMLVIVSAISLPFILSYFPKYCRNDLFDRSCHIGFDISKTKRRREYKATYVVDASIQTIVQTFRDKGFRVHNREVGPNGELSFVAVTDSDRVYFELKTFAVIIDAQTCRDFKVVATKWGYGFYAGPEFGNSGQTLILVRECHANKLLEYDE